MTETMIFEGVHVLKYNGKIALCSTGNFNNVVMSFGNITYDPTIVRNLSFIYKILQYAYTGFSFKIFEVKNSPSYSDKNIEGPKWLELGYRYLIAEEMKSYVLEITSLFMLCDVTKTKEGYLVGLYDTIPGGQYRDIVVIKNSDDYRVKYQTISGHLKIAGKVVSDLLCSLGLVQNGWPTGNDVIIEPNAPWLENIYDRYLDHRAIQGCSDQTIPHTTTLPAPYYTKAPGNTVIKLPSGAKAIEILLNKFDLSIASEEWKNTTVLSDQQLTLIRDLNGLSQPHALLRVEDETSIMTSTDDNFYYRVLNVISPSYKFYKRINSTHVKFMTAPVKYYYSSIYTFDEEGQPTPFENIRYFMIDADFIKKNPWFKPTYKTIGLVEI